MTKRGIPIESSIDLQINNNNEDYNHTVIKLVLTQNEYWLHNNAEINNNIRTQLAKFKLQDLKFQNSKHKIQHIYMCKTYPTSMHKILCSTAIWWQRSQAMNRELIKNVRN